MMTVSVRWLSDVAPEFALPPFTTMNHQAPDAECTVSLAILSYTQVSVPLSPLVTMLGEPIASKTSEALMPFRMFRCTVPKVSRSPSDAPWVALASRRAPHPARRRVNDKSATVAQLPVFIG